MFAKVRSAHISGIDGLLIDVEAYITDGLPSLISLA